MDEKLKKTQFNGQEVEVLGATYEAGAPALPGAWRKKLENRKEMLAYLKTAERYWYASEGFGSEKRRNPA